MKTLTLIRSLRSACMLLFTGIQISFAQVTCPTTLTVSATSNTNGDVAGAISLNSPPTSSGVYMWSISNGSSVTYYNSTSSTHTFANMPSGTYSVCAEYNDSIYACTAYGNCAILTVTNTNTVNCLASYSYYTDSSCVTHFSNTSTGMSLSYEWYDMAGGFTLLSTQQNPNIWLSAGTHYIALYTYSSGQFCDSVTHTIAVNCNTTTPTCNASFSYYTDSTNCLTFFYNSSTGANLTYQWNDMSNGALVLSTQPTPTLSLSPGLHSIKLYVLSNGYVCDSTIQQVNVNCNGNPSGGCNASFQIFADSANPGNYFAYDLSTGTGLSYLWDFGDGTTSTQQYPFHQYAVLGHYVVCLTVTGTNSCTSTFCDSSSVHKTAGMSSLHVIPNTVTGINEVSVVKTLKAYPNPMTDELNVEIETNIHDNLAYTLTDNLGRTIVKNDITSPQLKISTASLDKGFYFLSVSDKNGKALKTIKLVK